ncbi:hypothetical protein E2C01_084907 [Portunus trituberculatus]|uniref:Uncharacterized protein n=1 Tax=Portunus trituberculatus TaxID=210409 RepID=A0A5B7J626_PORTR|nr:hypothetical protein [Portunus trituberculatus]
MVIEGPAVWLVAAQWWCLRGSIVVVTRSFRGRDKSRLDTEDTENTDYALETFGDETLVEKEEEEEEEEEGGEGREGEREGGGREKHNNIAKANVVN